MQNIWGDFKKILKYLQTYKHIREDFVLILKYLYTNINKSIYVLCKLYGKYI